MDHSASSCAPQTAKPRLRHGGTDCVTGIGDD